MLKHGNPNLSSTEHVVESWLANRVQSPWRAVGGKLWLTNERLLFVPNNVEQHLGGDGWECPIGDVSAARTVDRQLAQVFSGGLRSRLELTTQRSIELFVVKNPDAVARQLTAIAT